MKLGDVKKLVELPPKQRAVKCLELGAEIQQTRPRAMAMGAMPAALKRPSVEESAAAPLMMRLHGVTGAAPEKMKGLKATGRQLDTEAGKVDDFVLTSQTRKKMAAASLRQRGKDKSIADLAVRHLAINMFDSDPVARCCAAYAYWQATLSEAAIPILENAIDSGDPEERILAAHCLAKMEAPQAKRLQGTAKDDRPQTPPQPVKNSMTVIIHGTFAKNEPWYKPGGDFHTYIKKEVYADVYSGQDFYFWSGRYAITDAGLKDIWKKAAEKLVSWVQVHPAKTLRLIAHSHGNNVVNMATQMGLKACSLIQLSPPVHGWNLPVMQNVSSNRLFNIHSSIDLVVKVDGGAQDYSDTLVAPTEKTRIISWFGHSDAHVPKLWKKKKIPALVKTVCP